MRSPVSLSLIICTYRRPIELKRLLVAIGGQSMLPAETLIVDGSPDDETRQVVEALEGGALLPDPHYYLVPPEHRGLTRQRNYGIARARGDVIAFLDDDTVPEPGYVEELLACFERHPATIGVGGYISNEGDWRRVDGRSRPPLAAFRWGEWERRDDYRWRLRKLLGLASSLPPGRLPPFSHGRPVSFLPPDGQDHEVDFIMGGASAWRRQVFDRHHFSPYFEGYGLYEDLDFCIRASRDGPLYLCTRARLAHYHAPSGRPNHFRYGVMVVRNGWFVWRRRWPALAWPDRLRWWAITILLTVCRLVDALRGPARRQALDEAGGRIWGMATLWWDRPGASEQVL